MPSPRVRRRGPGRLLRHGYGGARLIQAREEAGGAELVQELHGRHVEDICKARRAVTVPWKARSKFSGW